MIEFQNKNKMSSQNFESLTRLVRPEVNKTVQCYNFDETLGDNSEISCKCGYISRTMYLFKVPTGQYC
jgi:hypothetical protein